MIQRFKKGFTIIELMLAMTLVSILVVAIAVVMMQISSIMNKVKTMKDLNSAGRSINADFTSKFNSVNNIQGWSVATPSSSASSNATYVKLSDGSGAFCTGDYSYLWNSATTINNANKSSIQVPIRYVGSNNNDTSVRLVRVRDNIKSFCSDQGRWSRIDRNSGDVVDLISAGETGLMIYDINFRKIREDVLSGQSLINIQYVLGTKNDNGQIRGFSCDPGSFDKNYCSINRFDLIVRTAGRR